MTIRELYEWAKANKCADYDIVVECYDKYTDTLDAYIKKTMLEKYNCDVAIKCREE